jgi:hypothetical protein
MTRLGGICIGLGAFFILASLPAEASAGWELGRGGSSYSPLHYWVPRLYTCRAYHRPVNYIDVAEYDSGVTDSTHVENCPPSGPEVLPPPKKEAEKSKK